jgi:hypothetical protein
MLERIQEIAEEKGIGWTTAIQSFGEECYKLGREYLIKLQQKGLQRVKAEGKKLGRPKGSKDSKEIKRNPIKRYISLLRKSKAFKELPEQQQKEFELKIKTIQSKKDYVILKHELMDSWVKLDFSRLWEVV